MSLVRRPVLRAALVPLVAVLVLAGLLVGAPAQAQKIKPTFFGMHDNDWRTPPSVTVGAANLTPAATYWSSLQPTRSSSNWTKLTLQVQGAEAVNAQPMIVLGRTPKWASSKPHSKDYADYMPDMSAWKSWVTQVAKRYGSRLDYQIWPEPNIIENWKGTTAQMAKLTAVASTIINKYAAKPRIVSPAFAVRLKQQKNWLIDYFKEKVNGYRVAHYINAIAIDPFPLETGKPEDSFKLVQDTKKALARIGVHEKIWNNEINYGVKGGFRDTDVSYPVDVQQSYVIRTYVLSAAAKAERTYWLSWYYATNTMGIKMSEADGTALPPATSYEIVRSWLNKTSFQGCKKSKSELYTCTTKKGRKEVRRVYWDPSGSTVIKTPRSTLRVEDQEGGVNGDHGSRKIKVGYRPIMVASRK